MIATSSARVAAQPGNPSDLLLELQDTLAHGTVTRRVETLRKITDLFVARSVDYSDEQVGLFDDVFECLVERIETAAKALLATRLAPIPEAPPRIVRTLAFDELIEVAGPVLSQSERLDDATLIENARTRSQAHMLAISRRKTLSSAVTDVLVDLGHREVAQSIAANSGAKLSENGFAKIVDRSENDDDLATLIGTRPEIPRAQFIKLLARASNHVRARLESQRVKPSDDIPGAVDHAATEAQTATASVSKTSVSARLLVQELKDRDKLDEAHIISFARGQRFDEINASLAILAGVAISTVEIMMVESRSEGILVLSKIIGLSWTAVSAILDMRQSVAEARPIDLEACKTGYEQLKTSTAQQVLRFHRMRQLTAK